MDVNRQTLIEKITEHTGDFVPIIGEEMFMVGNVTLQEYVLKCFRDNKSTLRDDIDDDVARRLLEIPFYTMLSMIQKRMKNGREFENHLKYYIDCVQKNGTLTLRQDVSELLEVANFPLVLTTICFRTIECMLEKTCKVSSYWHRWGQKDETNTEAIETDGTLVYHLFGEKDTRWVYNEKLLLECMHSHQNVNNSLPIYLQDRHLLCLGCALPNWLFRFLWFPMTLLKGNTQYPDTNTDGMWSSSNNPEKPFAEFLEEIGYLHMPDLHSFIVETTEGIRTKKMAANSKVRAGEYKYDVFLSYKREDAVFAEHIHSILTNKFKLVVWMDRDSKTGKIDEGGDYWQRIKKGIEQSRYFMPVVSQNYQQKYLNRFLGFDTSGEGLFRENAIAVEHLDEIIEKITAQAGDGIPVYVLPVIDFDKCPDINNYITKGILPKELFDAIQLYYYSEDGAKDTFSNHKWGIYRQQ